MPRTPAAPAAPKKERLRRPVVPTSTSWGVFAELRVDRRRRRLLRLAVTGVPVDVRRPAVLEALEGAGYDATFSDAGVAWANHVLLPETKWPAELEKAPDAAVTTWELLQAHQAVRTVTLRLSPADYAAIALAAAAAGEPLYPWCRRQLLEATS